MGVLRQLLEEIFLKSINNILEGTTSAKLNFKKGDDIDNFLTKTGHF